MDACFLFYYFHPGLSAVNHRLLSMAIFFVYAVWETDFGWKSKCVACSAGVWEMVSVVRQSMRDFELFSCDRLFGRHLQPGLLSRCALGTRYASVFGEESETCLCPLVFFF